MYASSENIAVLLEIINGNFAEGFAVQLKILNNGQTIARSQNRYVWAPAPQIQQFYQEWASSYEILGRQRGNRAIGVVESQAIYASSLDRCREMYDILQEEVRRWFKQPAFENLRYRIMANVEVTSDRSTPIIIDPSTGSREQDNLLRKLPWHLWDLFDFLDRAEVALMTKFTSHLTPLEKPIKVLGIFGSSEGLDLASEQLNLHQLEQQGAEVLIREQPSRQELHNRLYNQSWDILFFSGHSDSSEELRSGYLLIQDNYQVSIDELEVDLRAAVNNGLKLAIFNSCNGLGIAERLADFNAPTIIVMREPVPDRVARKFFAAFLQEFTLGQPLSLAMRKARERLHWMESDRDFPCPAASWLPIICLNPNQPELVFPQSVSSPQTEPITSLRTMNTFPRQLRKILIFIGLIALGLGLAIVIPIIINPPGVCNPKCSTTFAEVPNVPLGTFNYGGSTTWETSNLRGKIHSAIQRIKPNFELIHLLGIKDSDEGTKRLLNGDLKFAISSRPVQETIKQEAENKGFKLEEYPVAINPIGVAVNPQNKILGITKTELIDIYNCKRKNWKDIDSGLPSLPIIIIDRNKNPNETVQEITGDAPIGSCKADIVVDTPTQALQLLKNNPGGRYSGAIYSGASVAQVVGQCGIKALSLGLQPGKFISPYEQPLISPSQCGKPLPNGEKLRNKVNKKILNTDDYFPITRLYVVVKENGKNEQQAGEAYANYLKSDEGQKLVEEAGFFSIN